MTALEQWMAAGLVEVPLPSGFRIKVLPVSPTTLVLLDLAPTLVDEVLDAAAAGSSKENVSRKVGHSALDVALRAVRYLWDPASETWEPVALTTEAVARGALVPADVDAIMAAALAGLDTGEGGTGIEALRPFRHGATGNAAGTHGGAVRVPAVGARRDRRSAARAGAGRGAGRPAGNR